VAGVSVPSLESVGQGMGSNDRMRAERRSRVALLVVERPSRVYCHGNVGCGRQIAVSVGQNHSTTVALRGLTAGLICCGIVSQKLFSRQLQVQITPPPGLSLLFAIVKRRMKILEKAACENLGHQSRS